MNIVEGRHVVYAFTPEMEPVRVSRAFARCFAGHFFCGEHRFAAHIPIDYQPPCKSGAGSRVF